MYSSPTSSLTSRIFTLVLLSLSSTYAFTPILDPQICHLPSSLESLHAQIPSTDSILQAVSVPGSSSRASSSGSSLVKLAYITPWNGHGYDLAKWHASKFTHISPVWYQLTLQHNQKPQLLGGHDVDESWLDELRSASRPPKIVPRVQIQFSREAAEAIRYYPQGQPGMILDVLLQEVERYGYDGLTVEMPQPQLFKALLELIGEELHANGKELVLVVPPLHAPEQMGTVIGADDLRDLEDAVDYFSVMTYDHAASLGREGPNSPLPWMREVMEALIDADTDGDDLDADLDDDWGTDESGRGLTPKQHRTAKILLGLPFYGYKLSKAKGMEAYTASNYMDFLREHKDIVIQWDDLSKEHRMIADAGKEAMSVMWYPSLLSLLHRLQLAEELGVGIAIWELGQGLDQFVDVL
ncbi:hypothetical protein BP6252_00030 [Coleophoma cylindrospora]|uniref:Chitinase domain-containing protein 1 n=1 Tax=Coleophoma cylindrospora TaxID=1849047 RepID=A0A3D8SQC4_9HELO|nr:hypothetical protein BP6252_00030 [Coleophoma cylindrospora]